MSVTSGKDLASSGRKMGIGMKASGRTIRPTEKASTTTSQKATCTSANIKMAFDMAKGSSLGQQLIGSTMGSGLMMQEMGSGLSLI